VNVTVLVDNTVAKPIPKGLRGEWGFAAAVGPVLSDTGQSAAVVHNARRLGVGTDFRTVVLSHTHFDHTAGLEQVLDPLDKPTVYCHPDVWTERFSLGPPGGDAFPDPVHVGIPYSRAEVESGADLVEHRDSVWVTEEIVALGEIPREYGDTATGKRPGNDGLVDDSVADDQALAVRTGDGVALVLGCCHSGLRNSIEYAESVVGDTVRYVIGGTHLVARDADEVHDLADWLDGRLDLFAGTHCTGFEAERVLSERLPDAFRAVGVVVGLLFDRMAGVYVMLSVPMSDVLVLQNPLATDRPEWATFLPGHHATDALFEAAFTAGVDVGTALSAAGYATLLLAGCVAAFHRSTEVTA
jgi:7,8-dihydropterin-6-yl-methyl-4-(beta-D-ribofuranosyl)aminobenzene 5'-phosphate synthase